MKRSRSAEPAATEPAATEADASSDSPAETAPRPRIGGLVRMWDEEKGFGFIRPHDGGADVFCHASAIEDGDALATGFDVGFVRVIDEERGRPRAEQVTGGVGEAPHADPLLAPCLPFGAEVLAPQAQQPRPAGPRGRERVQEATYASWLSLSTMVRSLGQTPLELELRDGARVEGTLHEADAAMNLTLRAATRAAPPGEEAAGGPAHEPHESIGVEGGDIRSVRIPQNIDAVRAFFTKLKQVDKAASQFSRQIRKPLPPAAGPAEKPAPLVGGFTTEADAHGAEDMSIVNVLR